MAAPHLYFGYTLCPDVKARYYFGSMVGMAEANNTRPEMAGAPEYLAAR